MMTGTVVTRKDIIIQVIVLDDSSQNHSKKILLKCAFTIILRHLANIC